MLIIMRLIYECNFIVSLKKRFLKW
jgi:hypothetical protein